MRGSRLSCVLCTLLSLFMVMPASVASAATEGSGGSGEVTIHYYDSAGWAKPFAYMYGDGVRSASWPGERMADDGDGWYSVTVNAPHGLRVLFSDNGKSQHPGTNQPGYEVNGEAWFVGSTRYDSMPEGVKVHFYDYAKWGKARLYYYSEAARGRRGRARPCMRTATDGIPRLSSERNPLACCSTTAARDRLRQAVRKAI